MEVEEFVDQVAKFSLHEDHDNVEIDIPQEITMEIALDFRFAIVESFPTEVFILLNEMSNTLAANWRFGKGVAIQEIAPQLFLFRLVIKQAYEGDGRGSLGL